MKYPEYREAFKNAHWFGGQLCKHGDAYYKLVRVEGEKEKQLRQFTYDELGDRDKELIEQVNKEREESDARLVDYFHNILPSRQKLVDYVRRHGQLAERSHISESEYWSVKSEVNGREYTVRISGHVYPTGSMTNVNLGVIDSTDEDCREYCKLLGI